MGRHIILIGNPIAGKAAAKKIEKAAGKIKGKGFDVEVMLTGKKGDAESFAREISQLRTTNSALLIIAAGGDGTYNEVVNGIAGSDVPMAIIPLGTTNVLAKELGIPENVNKAVDIALNGIIHKVCLGKITLQEHKIQDSGFSPQASRIGDKIQTMESGLSRYFLLMAGVGYDGETVYGVNSRIKAYSGKGAYLWSGFRTLLSWCPEPLTITADGNSCRGYSVIVCNAAKYGGHFKVAPDSNLEDPHLYVFIMHGEKRIDIVRYIMGILTKRHLRLKDITYLQAKKIEIQGDTHIQIDGDYLGRTPAVIEMVPDALNLVY